LIDSDDEENVYGSEDESAAEFMFDINTTMDVLESPLQKVDTRLKFCDALRSLSQKSPADLQNLVNALPPKQKKFVMESFQAQSVQLSGGENKTATRRIVKVVRRTGAQQQAQPQKNNAPNVKIPERK